MVRPCKARNIDENLVFTCFKPVWIEDDKLERVEVNHCELQAIKLADYDCLNQKESADFMNISAPTFNRILKSARKKISTALIEWKAIKVVES